MSEVRPPAALAALPRVPTAVPGLDAILGGGLLAGDAYLVVGAPGTGKTTLGNQLAFAHAAAGGTAVVATLLTEGHDRMLAHLAGFGFADAAPIGVRLHYLGFHAVLEAGGADGVLEALWAAVRDRGATLLVLDGAGAALAGFDAGRFVHGLQVRSAMARCTTVLLAGVDEAAGARGHADGVIELTNDPTGSRDVRWLRVAKLRGSTSLGGRHRFAIGDRGVAVFPRLEAAAADLEPALGPWARVPVGVAGLDAMLGGGLPSAGSTLVLGTPGAGKTLLGLHFLTEGARRGEPGLIAAFNETGPALAATADRIGLGLGSHLESGLVRVLWCSPMERSPDEWAWNLLDAVEAHGTRRLVIDAFTDLARLFAVPERHVPFATALANALRDRGVTTVVAMEIDAFAAPELSAPVPNISAVMDNGILLRTTELRSELRRLVSILKLRGSPFDPAIREFVIGPDGITVGQPLSAAGLLTGMAVPDLEAG